MRISDWSSDVCSPDLQPWCSCGSTRTPCPGRWASATGANDDGGEDMKPATGCIIAATLALAFAVPSAAVEVDNLDAFKQHFGRYAPGRSEARRGGKEGVGTC